MTKKRIAILAIAAALAVGGGALALGAARKPVQAGKAPKYETKAIARATIESSVSSSGTLSVVSSVSVLSEMSGRLETVTVDYNDRVKAGQVLATINTDILKLKAKAAQAAVDKARANYDLQAIDAKNSKALFDKGLLSEYDYKTSQATLAVRDAELASALASFEEIETEIDQYAIITSPINGIILERHVAAGESVVGGSGTSTTLFTIAQDLSKMQIEAEVDELDIGSIEVGQEVRFTVEADPASTFAGAVKEIRLVPEVSDNVVYYYVIILADNSSGKLLPGMTASVEFIKEKKENVLVVPSSAFRFTPSDMDEAAVQKAVFTARLEGLSDEQKATALARYDEAVKARAAAGASTSGISATGSSSSGLSRLMGGTMPGGPGGPGGMPGAAVRTIAQGSGQTAAGQAAGTAAAVAKKTLWYLDESGKPAVKLVETGSSDGTNTELIGADALEGLAIIVKLKVE